MNVGLCKVSDFCGCARGVAAAFLLLLSILTVCVKTGAGGVGWKLGAFYEKAPAFGGKRGAVGEKVATLKISSSSPSRRVRGHWQRKCLRV